MDSIIFWTLVDRRHADLTDSDHFLTPSERDALSKFRFPKRREEWLLGRWAAKSLVGSLPIYQNFSADEMEIDHAPGGAPYLRLPSGSAAPDCLSISHCNPYALCGLSLGPMLKFGVDLERIEPRAENFIEDYFTPSEREMVHAYPVELRDLVATLVWSLKEAMLKALGVGLHWDTRRVEIMDTAALFAPNGHGPWREIQVSDHDDRERTWKAWWQHRDDYLLTVAGYEHGEAGMGSFRLVEKGFPL